MSLSPLRPCTEPKWFAHIAQALILFGFALRWGHNTVSHHPNLSGAHSLLGDTHMQDISYNAMRLSTKWTPT